ncbi:unnamed protein product [Spirodela intermedia]|uniref:TOD1/MUCI70 glycosyltransferase-like domain-containing protein n=1 Tax=Spirodela intermedia TaxID=51605 RepID=A0A7I8JT97_SPIIN|nr:unnamed protein product [Spirodela intermedia]CAA6672995.1 unnamed protein product [Spirodela intermedia]
MTGGSLGLRSGSYGSLQQHLPNDTRLPIQQTTGNGRKNQRMSLSGGKEKGQSRIYRLCFPIRVGVYLAFMASVGALMIVMAGVFLFRRGGDVSEISETTDDSLFSQVRHPSVALVPPNNLFTSKRDQLRDQLSVKILSPPNNYITVEMNASQSLAFASASPLPSKHPCEGFSFSPPPVDRKRTGPRPCYSSHAICTISISRTEVLTYFSEEDSTINESNGGSLFGGHPSLEQRNETFNIKESMTVHCGFSKGNRPGNGCGFDIDTGDLLEMEQCHGVVVASAIFGNYDVMQQPQNISEISMKTVCFYMFVDEETEAYIKNSSTLDSLNKVGLWRVVVVRNLPYVDARRTGKVPKLLLHRIFPNARYSLWIDGKLQLVVDPYQILERFLWRKNTTFAISRHYKRFDVFDEAEANKAAGKYDNASIDYQIQFYANEGLTHYSPAKLPITSDVPEGCVIIREHLPITNLFTCLWFNEVDRFTSRDQLSFSTVRDRLMAQVGWKLDMFLDCERRNFVVQSYHRDLLESMVVPPPPSQRPGKSTPTKLPAKRGRERRPSSRRHRMRAAGSRDSE